MKGEVMRIRFGKLTHLIPIIGLLTIVANVASCVTVESRQTPMGRVLSGAPSFTELARPNHPKSSAPSPVKVKVESLEYCPGVWDDAADANPPCQSAFGEGIGLLLHIDLSQDCDVLEITPMQDAHIEHRRNEAGWLKWTAAALILGVGVGTYADAQSNLAPRTAATLEDEITRESGETRAYALLAAGGALGAWALIDQLRSLDRRILVPSTPSSRVVGRKPCEHLDTVNFFLEGTPNTVYFEEGSPTTVKRESSKGTLPVSFPNPSEISVIGRAPASKLRSRSSGNSSWEVVSDDKGLIPLFNRNGIDIKWVEFGRVRQIYEGRWLEIAAAGPRTSGKIGLDTGGVCREMLQWYGKQKDGIDDMRAGEWAREEFIVNFLEALQGSSRPRFEECASHFIAAANSSLKSEDFAGADGSLDSAKEFATAANSQKQIQETESVASRVKSAREKERRRIEREEAKRAREEAKRERERARAARRSEAARQSSRRSRCYRWHYPFSDDCGMFWKGARECKATPSIDSMGNATARAYCRPTKGEPCNCE